MSTVEEIEARRAARKAEAERARSEQRAEDLEAIDALEVEYGDSYVAVIDVPYSPGLPTCAAVRCPKPAEIKRYRARVSIKGDQVRGAHEGAEELARSTIIYPADADVRDRLLDSRPTLAVQLGTAALDLAQGKRAEEGKG